MKFLNSKIKEKNMKEANKNPNYHTFQIQKWQEACIELIFLLIKIIYSEKNKIKTNIKDITI